MGLISWMKANLRGKPAEPSHIEKTEEIYLHDAWLDQFQDELERWADRER